MRDYKREYRNYHARPEQKRNRAARNLWNRRLKEKSAGMEIDRRKPLANGGSNDAETYVIEASPRIVRINPR